MDTFNGGVTVPFDLSEMFSVRKVSKYKDGPEYLIAYNSLLDGNWSLPFVFVVG